MNKKKDKKPDKQPEKQAKPKQGNERIEALEQQVDDLNEALLRERADSANIRRRHETQIADLKKHVTADVVRNLLPAIDNLERALTHVPYELRDTDYVKGVQGVAKQFNSIFKKLGIEKIPTVGMEFNPNFHEAVTMEDGDGDKEVVSNELQPGYVLDDYVLRHAMVKVRSEKSASGSSASNSSDEPDESENQQQPEQK